MKKKWLLLSILFAGWFSLFFTAKPIFADIDSISVTPLISDSNETSRFELNVKPGDTRDLGISLTNFGNQNTTLVIRPVNAGTSVEGQYDYNQPATPGKNGLKADFSSMTSQKTVKLQPQQTKDVHFTVKVPSSGFDGLMMGGFNIYTQGDKNVLTRQSANVPVMMTESQTVVQPKMRYNSITTKAVNAQPFIFANIANTKPVAMKNVSYDVTLTRRGPLAWLGINWWGKTYHQVASSMKVAPNSVLPVGFNLKQEPVKAGTYTVDAKITAGEKKWHITGTDTITKAQAGLTNQNSRNLIYDYTWVFELVIAGLVILVLFVIWLIYRQVTAAKRQNKKAEERAEAGSRTGKATPTTKPATTTHTTQPKPQAAPATNTGGQVHHPVTNDHDRPHKRRRLTPEEREQRRQKQHEMLARMTPAEREAWRQHREEMRRRHSQKKKLSPEERERRRRAREHRDQRPR